MKRRLLFKMPLWHQRFFPAGDYIWTAPYGCTSVDVFLVGGGGAGAASGGGGGYTKTITITTSPGKTHTIVVGKGGIANSQTSFTDATQSKFDSYIADFGKHANDRNGGDGGSGGGNLFEGGSDGGDGDSSHPIDDSTAGKGQGTTTRDFGEKTGKINAGGGGGQGGDNGSYHQHLGGKTDYIKGSGTKSYGYGGGGYGGGGGSWYQNSKGGNGGDGTVLIRYYAWEKGTVTTTVPNYNDELDLPIENLQ